MNTQKILAMGLGLVLLTGCSFSISSPPTPTPFVEPTPTQSEPATVTPTQIPTETPIQVTATSTSPALTAVPTLTRTPPPVAMPDVCTDPQVVTLINSLKSAMQNGNGELLSSLVHPTRGMEVRYFRDGNVVTYTAEQANFLFETTFEANWGAEPGSGLDKTGSFHDVIVPKLVDLFDTAYTLHCNDLQYGGATYEVEWPYDGDFYAIYFAGSEEYGYMDWNTWAVGIDYVSGKPYIYALMQFFWEP